MGCTPRDFRLWPKADIRSHGLLPRKMKGPTPFRPSQIPAVMIVRGPSSAQSRGREPAMRRRDFISGIVASTAMPLAARAQQQTPLVAFLNAQTAAGYLQARLELRLDLLKIKTSRLNIGGRIGTSIAFLNSPLILCAASQPSWSGRAGPLGRSSLRPKQFRSSFLSGGSRKAWVCSQPQSPRRQRHRRVRL